MNDAYKILFISLVLIFSSVEYAQSQSFSKESIPLIEEEVVFEHNFDRDLTQTRYFRLVYSYLNNGLDPYEGQFISVSEDSVVCSVTDYLEISSTALSTFAMYIAYDISFYFDDGECNMIIDNIKFMEKSSYEAQEKTIRDLGIRKYSAKDIMIDEEYRSIFVRGGSEKITEATIDMFNNIVSELDYLLIRDVVR